MRNFLDKLDSTNKDLKKQLLHKQVIKFFLLGDEQTIPEICDHFKWSIPTGTKLVQELVKKKILQTTGKRDSSGGRRPDVFRLNGAMGYVIAVELQLHSFKLTVVNLNHEVIHEFEDSKFDITLEEKALAYITRTVPAIIKDLKISKDKVIGVGIGITGRVDKITGNSYTYLNFNEPLSTTLSNVWKLPVYIDNDTHLMALGENNFGLARHKSNVIIINISRGIGAGIISNGVIHTGKSGFAGEFGHIHIANNNKLCICGKKGCLETVVSGIALEDEYNKDPAAKKGAKKLYYKEIVRLLKKNDFKADAIISKMGEDLGQAISILVHLLNPELIILSGGFTAIGDKLIYPIARGMNMYGLPQLVADCNLKISSLGERATTLGAFSLVFEKEFS